MHAYYQRFFDVIRLVPSGKVVSYGQVADLAGLPGRARMVGKALRKYANHEHIAWHRVVKGNGQLALLKHTELSIDAPALQASLLREEGVSVMNNRVKMPDVQWQPDSYTLLHVLKF